MLAALVVASAAPATAWSSTGGNANAGDVWVDNVGQPPGPGHEMDPHLACQDINLWGSGLADGSGTFTIDGWAPSGSKDLDYGPATWSYNLSGAGTQMVAVIDVHALISAAVRNGDVPLRTQGYHFKLQFSQDPHKHKTFWVQCPAPSTPPSGPPSSPPQSPPPPPATPVTVVSPPPAPVAPAVTPAPKPQKHAKAHKHRPRHRARHRRPRQVRRRHVPRPTFTG
jgi:hypothetical protein